MITKASGAGAVRKSRARKAALGIALLLILGFATALHTNPWKGSPRPLVTMIHGPDPVTAVITPVIAESADPYGLHRIGNPAPASVLCGEPRCVPGVPQIWADPGAGASELAVAGQTGLPRASWAAEPFYSGAALQVGWLHGGQTFGSVGGNSSSGSSVLTDIPVTVHEPPAPTMIPAAVPEPSAWALMLSGFFTIGAAMRRRKMAAAYA